MSAADFEPLFQSAAQQYGLDPNILKSLTSVESNFNPSALNKETGASGLLQFIPATAKAYGIDPNDPAQAIGAGAKMFRENLDRFGGNVEQAVAAHFAGPDQKLWGPKTDAYVSKVSRVFGGMKSNAGFVQAQGPQGGGDDPIMAALSGKPAQAAPVANDDPIMAALSGKAPAARIALDNMAPDAKPKTLYDELSRQVGLTARAGVTGLTGIPSMVGDALNSGVNLGIRGINSAAGTKIGELPMVSSIVQNTMNSAGVPQPQNDTERVVQSGASAMAGVNPSVAIGNLLAKSASPVASAIGTGLTQLPGMQIAGAAGAGAGGEIAHVNGAGPAGQIGASVLGGVLGSVAPSAALATARGIKNVANNAVGILQPVVSPERYVGKQLAQALGSDAGGVAENIRNTPQYVPNSLPTTAQAGANPMLVATEKSAANANPTMKIALATRDAQNNAARWEVLNDVAKTPEQLATATAERSATAQPLYDAAHTQSATVGADFVDFVRRPAVQQAMKEADLLAKNEGVALQWPTPENPVISGHALDYTSRALGDLISKAKSSGSAQEVRALTGARDHLTNWTEQQIPAVKQATDAYRSLSVPVNTMQAGQQMAEQLGGRAMNAMGDPQITPQSFQSALAKALKAQKYGIHPEAETSLNNIGSDLQRGTISNSLRSPGSDTAYNISADGWLARQLYGKDFEGASMLGKGAGALGATLTGHPIIGMGILGGGKKLGESVGNNLNAQLSELLLHPEKLLPYLDAARKNSPQALAQALGRNVSQGAIGASVGAAAKP